MSAITDSARGQHCTLRIAGYCDHETVVACHIYPGGHGKVGAKCLDLHIAYGCAKCHDIADRRGNEWRQIDPLIIMERKLAGMIETQTILLEKGLISA